MPFKYEFGAPLMVVPVLGPTTIQAFPFEISAQAPATPSAEALIIPARPLDIQYMFRNLVTSDAGDCWFRFRILPSAVSGVSAIPPETPWLRAAEGPSLDTIIQPPGWLVRLPLGASMFVGVSAGTVTGPPGPKRIAGIVLVWRAYFADPIQGTT